MVVSLTGGEPFLRMDLPEVVAAIARHHFPVLTTHGWLVTPDKARAAWEAGLECATVRLHGTEAAAHDSATGLPGSYARAREAVRSFARTRSRGRQRVNVKVRLGDGSTAGLEDLLSRAAEMGATVSVEPGYPVAGTSTPGLSARLLALKARHPNFRSGSGYLGRFDEAAAAGVGGCQAARAFVNVDHRGRISKCVEFQGEADRVGDLTAEDLSQVAPRLRKTYEHNSCRACWHASRGEVESLYTARGLVATLPSLVRP
jgi:MoaA/NifB/PqqE/SkfB family radical SAM enzyme